MFVRRVEFSAHPDFGARHKIRTLPVFSAGLWKKVKSKSEPEPEPPRRVSRQLKKMLSAPKIGLRVAAAAAFGQHQKNIQSTKEKKGREKENRGDVCCASVATILCSLSLSLLLTHTHSLSCTHSHTLSLFLVHTHIHSLSHSLCRTFALWAEQVWKTISLSCLCRTEVLAFYEFFRFEIKRKFSEASVRFRL